MPKPNRKPGGDDKKRKYHGSGGGGGPSVKRGGPGVLLTCETGREIKCQREGMDILQYYMNLQHPQKATTDLKTSETTEKEEDKKPSGSALDQELDMLRRQQHPKTNKLQSQHPDFSVYDTGCRGTILVLCARSNCHVIPPIVVVPKTTKDSDAQQEEATNGEEKESSSNDVKSDTAAANGGDSDPPSSKRLKADDETNGAAKEAPSLPKASEVPQNTDPWDPVPMIELIFKQSAPDFKGDTLPPSSRFVTRMIPIQATCFASLEEIQPTTKALLERFLEEQKIEQQPVVTGKDEPLTTFGIFIKRRNCSHLKSMTIIQALATNVVGPLVPTWKVDLKDPDVKIWVEVCRTTVGISIFHRQAQQNFNLAEVRASTKE